MSNKNKERDRLRQELEVSRNGQLFLVVKTYHPKKIWQPKGSNQLVQNELAN